MIVCLRHHAPEKIRCSGLESILEKVQRRASRLALVKKNAERWNTKILRKMMWGTHKIRTLFLSLVECYKIAFGINKS